ncbi:MAG: type II toxin-antitoxin system HicB family antitoxin [Bradyrhizobium sp.]
MTHPETPLEWPVTLEPAEEGGFVINFPDFREGWSQGDSPDEAIAQAADLLETMVANYMAEGWDLPDPSPPAGRPLVPLAPLVAAKAELYRTMRRAGISKAELARRIGISPQQAQRLFDIHHASRLDQIEAAMRVLGRRLVVTSDAA